MDWKIRIRAAFASSPDDDVLEELAQHATAIYAAARAEGCDAREADVRAGEQIAAWAADPALLHRRPRREPAIVPPAMTASPLPAILQDTGYAWRLLRRQPAYAAVLVVTIALGISATTVLGSVAYSVLLKPLPWADAPRLVQLYENRQGSTRRFRPTMTNVAYTEWQRSPQTLDALGGWTTRVLSLSGAPERIRAALITPSLLPMLQASPEIGRGFAPGDELPGREPILLLSHGYWRQRFGGRGDIVGQTLRLDGTTYTIVGVMPASFAFPDRETRAWMPFHVPPVKQPGQQGFSISMFQALGRLRDGVTPEQAAAEGTARGRGAPEHGVVAMAVFGSNGAIEVRAVPMLQAVTGEVKPALLIMLAAVGLLLITAIANAASLQLARATARRRELAIRSALGAARGRLVRQTLVENLLIGILGGVAGLALAAVMHRALPALLPTDFPRVDDLAFDLRIQAFAVAVSILAGLGCGVLPAWHVAKTDVVPALVEDSLAPAGGGLRSGTSRMRAAIMAGQIAIASVLLVCAALLGRSFIGMMSADVGYDPASTLTARLILPTGDYTPEQRRQILDTIVERLAATPGVARASFATTIPFAGSTTVASFPIKKRDGSSALIQTGSRLVSPGYFTALGQRVFEGREFTPDDVRGPIPTVIVNREFSRRYLDGRALGWTLPGAGGQPDRPIVGVAADAARTSVLDKPEPEIYSVAGRAPIDSSEVALIVRSSGDPHNLIPALRSAAREAAPNAPLESMMTMEDRASATLSRPRLYAALLGTFAAFALAIAAVGLFGVLSYTVAQRSREIGVRAALGARVSDIVGLVVRQSLVIAGIGIAAGLLAALWLTRALRTYLYGVTPQDAFSFAGVAVLLLAVAAIASIVPARRAASVDPVSVLRR